MGLKCSVLGHKYGETTVERDREEQGSEVVITIRETETCQRCGNDRVVSENKEVTAIATPGEPGDEPGGRTEPAATDDADVPDGAEDDVVDERTVAKGEAGETDRAAGDDAPAGAAGSAAVGADDAVTGDAVGDDATVDAAAVADAAADDEGGTGDEGAGGDAEEPVPGGDDAEILDAESDAPVTDDELADPSVDTDPSADGADDEPVEEDAVIMGADDEDGDDGRAPGEWPSEPGDGADDWSPEDLVDDDDHSITAPDAGTEENGAITVPDGSFACPECGYTTPVESSSLRAGDFCPECRKGALVREAGDATRKE